MGFFLMFGLVGLAMHRGSQLDDTISIMGGFISGALMMLVIAKMMQMLFRLQSSGNLNLSDAVGHVGTVYLHIPEGGTGQVQLTIDGRMRIYDAVTVDKRPVKTGDRVEVTEVIDEHLLVVMKV
jgi:membrane protein implicated in regulation of membrane protease activity